MCDKLVFDLSQEIEGSPNVFVRKDWINILDNQNQNYSNSQSVTDTSQLSNSNKYMSYREAYLAVPLLMTMGTPTGTNYATLSTTTSATIASSATTYPFNKFATAGCGDYVMGLKNWFGQIIHSLTLDYNGSTIIQQSPYSNMWNSFKLMTSLSYQDILSQGAQIGFFPDDATSFQYYPTGVGSAVGVAATSADFLINGGCCNVSNFLQSDVVSSVDCPYSSGQGNVGFLKRQQLINFDGAALVSSGTTFATGLTSSTYYSLLAGGNAGGSLNLMWKNYVLTRVSGVITGTTTPSFSVTTAPVLQYNLMATIKLKHIHSFFNMCPLLKGVFMKLTLNLNNTSTTIVNTYTTATDTAAAAVSYSGMYVSSVSNAVGGVNPLMIASPATSNGCVGAFAAIPTSITTATGGGTFRISTICNISVGARCLDTTLTSIGSSVQAGALAQSIYMYIPAYTFVPSFEEAYLSSPVKQINYTDIYQYQITNVISGGTINNLVTNGIANIKSILVIPFYSPLFGTAVTNVKSGISFNPNTNLPTGIPVYQSPFDPAGCGATSPLCHLTNFNVQISGQNAIYNLQKYTAENFNNQLYGQNSVNGGLTDGLTSSLIGRQEFDMEYCYYYVNVERMLPVEMGVPKSVQIIGQNLSSKACDYWVFVEHGVKVSIDVLTGARV
jgi:hypothetical protein